MKIFLAFSMAISLAHAAGVSEPQFNKLVGRVADALKTTVESHGVELRVYPQWGTLTGSHAGKAGKTWFVAITGADAKDPEMTPDGLVYVICHEFGHLLGGFPFAFSTTSAEGQADYFAAQTCARILWREEKQINAQYREQMPLGRAKEQCDLAWRDEDERNLCYRIVLSSLPLALIQSRLTGGTPSLQTFDARVVDETLTTYASAQCRLDTAVQGASCAKEFDLRIIPSTEQQAATYSCMDGREPNLGVRPACWFKPS